MSAIGETDKLEPRGNMTHMRINANQENQETISTGKYGRCIVIHVKGQLDESWSDWLDGMEVKLLENGEMILSGYIEDQAALMGLLNKLYGLNLALLGLSEA